MPMPALPTVGLELTSLERDVSVARRELKNIRKEVNALQQVHKKEVRHLENILNKVSEKPCDSVVSCPSEGDVRARQHLPVFTFKPIGHLRSVFQFKNGTPRQPGICEHSRGSLTIDKAAFSNPEHSLEGLEQFSHLWIIFEFHQNNNSYTKAKVKPPRLDGAKVGLFSTRSPYRPNPIGLTLAKMEGIEGATIHLSGIDILDGTPVLDIKPYIPDYDQPAERGSEENLDLNDSKLVVGDEELTVLESEVKEVFELSNTSINGKINNSAVFSSPLWNTKPLETTPSSGLETAFSEFNLIDSNIAGNVKSPGSLLDTSAFSSISLNRSLEIVKDALCGSIISDINDSVHDPPDLLDNVQTVKEGKKPSKYQNPRNHHVETADSVGESLNTTVSPISTLKEVNCNDTFLSKSSDKRVINSTLETEFSKLNMSDTKNVEHSNCADSSYLCSETPDKVDSSVNRSLEIIKDALCGSMVNDLNSSLHDPLDPLVIIQSVKKNMQTGKTHSPGNNSSNISADSKVGECLVTAKNSTSEHGYPFDEASTTLRTSLQFDGTSSFFQSASFVSNNDKTQDASASFVKLGRQAHTSSRHDKPLSHVFSSSNERSSDSCSVLSISSANGPPCCNYDDAILSQSSDSILANQKITVNPAFRRVSPQSEKNGLGTNAVLEGRHPKLSSPVQTHQKKFSPRSCGVAPKQQGHLQCLSSIESDEDTSSRPNVDACDRDSSCKRPPSDSKEANGQMRVASWINDANTTNELLVSFTQRAQKMIQMFSNDSNFSPFRLKHLKSWEDLQNSIMSVLKADPRSAYRRQHCQDRLYYFTVDCAHITCWFDGNLVEVLKVQPMEFASNLKG